MDGGNRRSGHGSNPAALLRVAEHFLRRRHFMDCRKYALQAQQSDPNLPGVAQLLAVADVLQTSETLVTGSQPDWYAVLQLDRFSCDADSIRERFNDLSFLLNPNTNRFPFADQAFNVVRDALYVLSNPLKKSVFDSELNEYVGNGSGEELNGFSFWTVCPYCYYVYEYPRVYVECCMRCPNEKCARAFHTVEIQEPPVEVLRGGGYICAGFLPLGFPWNQGKWNPFSPKTNSENNEGENVGGEGESVQGSEDSSDDDLDLFGVNAERVEADAVSGIAQITPEIGEKATRRKKSVAKNPKKLTGTGNRVKKFGPHSCEESELNEHSSEDVGQDISSGVAGVEFYDGEDDIFVSVQDHDDT